MLSILKKLFAKPAPKAVASADVPAPSQPTAPVPSVEVAHLSLAAIVARFPEELKSTLLRAPDAAATVALPLPTILKQLPLASVKMSLASLHRQAPGIFQPLTPGDKRTVEIPLAEVFRHIRPHLLKRRPDQRPFDLPENTISLFSDPRNPHAVAPSTGNEEPSEPKTTVLDLDLDGTPDMPRMLKMDDGLRAHFSSTHRRSMPVDTATAQPALREATSAPRVIPPPTDFHNGHSEHHSAAISFPGLSGPPSLTLELASLAANWPDGIRAEVNALDPATKVLLPASEVSAGLAKGRVAIPWGKIRACLQPQPATPTATAADTELVLPLKIVAPAFLASSKKPVANRKRLTVDESIPALFNNGRTEMVVNAATLAAATPAVAPATSPVKRDPDKAPQNVGEAFGLPEKQEWTPAEIVAHVVRLPGVSGAIVSLQEGLAVATSLPDGVKSEAVAAFLPQIFARLNQYAGEMKLGDLDDLLFTTHGAHCQIYRLGFIYFAVLGKQGESLPWLELRLIVEELARQTKK